MQINNHGNTPAISTNQAIPTNDRTTANQSSQPAPEPGVQVSISAQAQQLAKTEKPSAQASSQPVHLPVEPKEPLTGEKLERAVQIKKTQMHYQVASDMLNVGSNNNKGISAPTAYYLSNNEDARESVLDTKSQQQSMNNMQAYQEQTAELNERYA